MAEPAVVTVSAAKLLVQKLVVAFVIGFAPVFLAGITTALSSLTDQLSTGGDIDFSFLNVLFASLVAGAVTAASRAVLALMPGVNLVASDKLHSLGKGDKPVAVKAEGQAP